MSRFPTRLWVFIVFFFATPLAIANSDSVVQFAKYVELSDGSKQLLSKGQTAGRSDILSGGVLETVTPRYIIEHQPVGGDRIVVLTARTAKEIDDTLALRKVDTSREGDERIRATDEVKTIISNGPSSNRIDLVFMGDGYTLSEKTKFFSDASHLADQMFKGATFQSYLPLFNVHAVFRASVESGIGKNDVPKNTAYGLYREGDTLRAIMPTNTAAAMSSCRKAPGCDYPIIIANDPYYGGLGGEVAITTSSKESGIIVLRHELGHNFGVVGEEYDGGGYFGANYGKTLASVSWRHWLTGTLRAEPSIARLVSWPWTNLNGKPFSANFSSDGGWDKVSVRYSVSGIETQRDLGISLDGTALAFTSPGHSDRVFRLMEFNSGFSKGRHSLVFTEGVNDGNNVVSSVVIHEYKSDYNFSPSNIGAYPVFSDANVVLGYRPTHDTCLMRNMSSDHFCAVCQENNWIKFFGKVSPIDSVKATRVGKVVKVSVTIPNLGKWRPTPVAGEELHIKWFRNGVVQSTLADSKAIEIAASETKNRWEVEVAFSTPEVRKDPRSLLKLRKSVVF